MYFSLKYIKEWLPKTERKVLFERVCWSKYEKPEVRYDFKQLVQCKNKNLAFFIAAQETCH